ncbi:MAG: hypothetical protein HYX32_05165 [Actinobacteria bacterium]|nr:hypothetical protein [Actinomycetota bacterium]
MDELPVEPPLARGAPLPPRPPSFGMPPPPWDPHGRLREPEPMADDVQARRNRWYVATAVVAVLFLLATMLLLSYRAGQGSTEAAAPSTTVAPTTTQAPTSTTVPNTSADPNTTSPPASSPPTSTAPPTAESQCPTASAPSKNVEEAKVRAEVDTISTFVEQARGLTFKSAPCVQILDEQSFVDRINADIEKDRAAYEQEGNQLKAFGLIPPDLDYVATLKKLRSDSVSGWYDPRAKVLVVRSGGDIGAAQRVTLAHELTHSLQDQWFNLDRSEQYKDAKDEVAWTFKNIVEGDANRIESIFVGTLPIPDQRQFAKDRSVVANNDEQNGIPPAMRNALQDPYVYGETFVRYVMQAGGQAELDRVFNNPPPTSEQVMHLDKYAAREPPIDVPAPPVEPGAKVVDEGMTGEYMTAQMLRTANTAVTADQAAAGWGGDRTIAYTTGGKLCVRIDYAMDTPADLDELQQAFEAWLKNDQTGGRTVEKPTADRLRVTMCIPEPPPPPPPSGRRVD